MKVHQTTSYLTCNFFSSFSNSLNITGKSTAIGKVHDLDTAILTVELNDVPVPDSHEVELLRTTNDLLYDHSSNATSPLTHLCTFSCTQISQVAGASCARTWFSHY